jgi:uncharacterized membrane protein
MTEILDFLFRWTHVVAGVMWIGHLWFFNFVNAGLQKAIDGDAKRKVNPELLPRALYFFRWGAMWTLVSGILLLLLVYYHGGLLWDADGGIGGRAMFIHIGGIFGIYMAYNVWMKIWPAQQKIITAVKNGQAPDPALVTVAGARSKQNTYLSVPLLFFMVSNHYPTLYGQGFFSVVIALALIGVGFGIVYWLYQHASEVKGF